MLLALEQQLFCYRLPGETPTHHHTPMRLVYYAPSAILLKANITKKFYRLPYPDMRPLQTSNAIHPNPCKAITKAK